MGSRRWGMTFGVVAAMLVALASAAWACTAWTSMSPLSVPAGGPGTTVRVTAKVPTGPAEIRWDGITGPLLGTAEVEDGSFTREVRIPDAPAGVHYVVVTNAAGQWTRAPFKIQGPGGEAPSPSPSS